MSNFFLTLEAQAGANIEDCAQEGIALAARLEQGTTPTYTPEEARSLIEDCLTSLSTSLARGIAQGTIGTFYTCGLISEEEWEAYLARIPAEPYQFQSGREVIDYAIHSIL